MVSITKANKKSFFILFKVKPRRSKPNSIFNIIVNSIVAMAAPCQQSPKTFIQICWKVSKIKIDLFLLPHVSEKNVGNKVFGDCNKSDLSSFEFVRAQVDHLLIKKNNFLVKIGHMPITRKSHSSKRNLFTFIENASSAHSSKI